MILINPFKWLVRELMAPLDDSWPSKKLNGWATVSGSQPVVSNLNISFNFSYTLHLVYHSLNASVLLPLKSQQSFYRIKLTLLDKLQLRSHILLFVTGHV